MSLSFTQSTDRPKPEDVSVQVVVNLMHHAIAQVERGHFNDASALVAAVGEWLDAVSHREGGQSLKLR
ncbi:MAG: hypothetical protein VKK04_14315 [Synechococcales bacterium]|nr:hypothetical protein [Synechococcales bacterium]